VFLERLLVLEEGDSGEPIATTMPAEVSTSDPPAASASSAADNGSATATAANTVPAARDSNPLDPAHQ